MTWISLRYSRLPQNFPRKIADFFPLLKIQPMPSPILTLVMPGTVSYQLSKEKCFIEMVSRTQSPRENEYFLQNEISDEKLILYFVSPFYRLRVLNFRIATFFFAHIPPSPKKERRIQKESHLRVFSLIIEAEEIYYRKFSRVL